MPLHGDLTTMGLADLLQWIGASRKTGMLEILRNGSVKRIEFRKGFIGSCSSDDRESQLGHYLLTRGKISQEQLDQATARLQTNAGQRLGAILVEMGMLNESDVARFVAANVEETILVLFDWEDADFRFYEGASFDPHGVDVALQVSDLLLRGIQYQDELKLFRKTLRSSGSVLRRTDKPPPEQLLKHDTTRAIFESIDGEKTIAEVLRGVVGSQVLLLKFLYRLCQLDLVEIVEERPIEGKPGLLDGPGAGTRPAGPGGPSRSAGVRASHLGAADDLSDKAVEVEAARRLMTRDEYGAALGLLHASARAWPDDRDVGNLLCEAEVGYVRSAGLKKISPTSVPVPAAPGIGADALESEETFLLSLIDGRFDVQSILSLGTLREEDVVRVLEQMLDKGIIHLRTPAEPTASSGALGD